MEIHFPPELEAKLAHSAARQGRKLEELVQDAVAHYFEDEARFVQAVARGEQALQRGEYLTHEQVGQRMRRFLERKWKFVGQWLRRTIWSAFANGSIRTVRRPRHGRPGLFTPGALG
jgi:predicted transcriptional regulator